MNIECKDGSTTEFWQAEAILHSVDHKLYSWATFLLPTQSPRRFRLAYKVVHGASTGLYWVFKRETYPLEHTISPSLPECYPRALEACTTVLSKVDLEPQRITKDSNSKVHQDEQLLGPEVPETIRDGPIPLVVVPENAFTHDSESTINAGYSPSSHRYLHDFAMNEIERRRLSDPLIKLQIEGQENADNVSNGLNWLDLAYSDPRMGGLLHEMSSSEDWKADIVDDLVLAKVIEAKSNFPAEPTKPTAYLSITESEPEDIDPDGALRLVTRDLVDHDHQVEHCIEHKLNVSQIMKNSPAFHDLVAGLEKARQAIFVDVRNQTAQKPRLEKYILGDITGQASEEFANLRTGLWNAKGWAITVGNVKYDKLIEAHKYHYNKGYYQHPRLEEAERSCDWSWESKVSEVGGPLYPRTSLNEDLPSPPKNAGIADAGLHHHVNYLNYPVKTKTSTSPEISLWLTNFACRRNASFDPLTRQGVLVSQATKHIDPYQYTGPPEFLDVYSGTQLQNAITGYVNRVYSPRGSWQPWEYRDEAVPMLPDRVAWYTNFEHGYQGMQLPYFLEARDHEDVVVNGDCGTLGPVDRSYLSGRTADPVFRSPLRQEIYNLSDAGDSETNGKPFVAHLPSTVEKADDEDYEPASSHSPSLTEENDDRQAGPVEAHSPVLLKAHSTVEPLIEPEWSDSLVGLSEEDVNKENNDIYGNSMVATTTDVPLSRDMDEDIQGLGIDLDSIPSATGPHSPEISVFDDVSDEDEVSNTDESKPDEDHSKEDGLECGEILFSSERPSSAAHTNSRLDHLGSTSNYSESLVLTPGLDGDFSSGEVSIDSILTWTTSVGNLENPKATYLAQFSEDNIKSMSVNSSDPTADYLASLAENIEEASGKPGQCGYISHDVFKRRLYEDPMLAIRSWSWTSESSGDESVREGKDIVDLVDNALLASLETNVGDDMSVGDVLVDTMEQLVKPANLSLSETEAHSLSSTTDGSSYSVSCTSSPRTSDDSTLTTPGDTLAIDLEIATLQKRLEKLLDKKYAPLSLDDFASGSMGEEYIPLFPMVGDETPPEAKVITGILTEAAHHPELEKYIEELTLAMVSKNLRVRPTEDPKPVPKVVAVNHSFVDLEDSAEAPLPNAFSMTNPAMLYDDEIAILTAVRNTAKEDEAVDAAQRPKTIQAEEAPTNAEMDSSIKARNARDFEDNATVKGDQVNFQPVNTDLPRQLEIRIAPLLPMNIIMVEEPRVIRTSVIYTQQSVIMPTNEVFIEPIPTRAFIYYSDIVALESALDFDKYIYGTIDYGIAKKVKRIAQKLNFWSKSRAGS